MFHVICLHFIACVSSAALFLLLINTTHAMTTTVFNWVLKGATYLQLYAEHLVSLYTPEPERSHCTITSRQCRHTDGSVHDLLEMETCVSAEKWTTQALYNCHGSTFAVISDAETVDVKLPTPTEMAIPVDANIHLFMAVVIVQSDRKTPSIPMMDSFVSLAGPDGSFRHNQYIRLSWLMPPTMTSGEWCFFSLKRGKITIPVIESVHYSIDDVIELMR